MRFLVLLLLLGLGVATAQLTPPAQHVLLLAPQLLAFAGSDANFQSLAAGLTSGATVTLTTTAADGSREIATLTPAEPLSPADAARVLEAARQRLIGLGLGHPSAAEIAVALMGGKLITPAGSTTVAALVAGDPKKPLQLALRPFSGSRENYAALSEGLKEGRTITLKPVLPGGVPVIFTPPGGPLSDVEVAQALKLAGELLASQGLYDPTPDQVRSAIVGGRVQLAGGQSVLLRGVLEGRTRATAASPAKATSESAASGQRSDSAASGHTSDAAAPGHRSDTPKAGHTSDSPRTGHTSDRPVKAK
jgi:hypothetical protein